MAYRISVAQGSLNLVLGKKFLPTLNLNNDWAPVDLPFPVDITKQPTLLDYRPGDNCHYIYSNTLNASNQQTLLVSNNCG